MHRKEFSFKTHKKNIETQNCRKNELVPFPCIVRMFTVIARGTCNEMVEA